MENLVADERASHARYINHDLMGPIIHRWLAGLHQYISFFDDGDTTFLYCARAGVRIKELYELYLSGIGDPDQISANCRMFWISRLAVAKGTYRRIPDASASVIAREYHHSPLADLVRGILRHHPDTLEALDLGQPTLERPGSDFPEFIQSRDPVATALREYLENCGKAFEGYLDSLLEKNSRAVLIDSGWQGSAQSLLKHAYPQTRWKGIYFGRICTEYHDPSIKADTIGVLFEAEKFDPGKPETCFVLHRHIIETLLEPNGPSIEEVFHGEFKDVAAPLVRDNQEEKPDEIHDAMYLAVRSYLASNKRVSLAEIEARYQKAIRELATIIANPSRLDAQALHCKHRSADFGKELLVPVLLPGDHKRFTNSDLRIQHALWPQGQVALEHEGELARDLQNRITGLADNISYFDPNAFGTAATPGFAEKPQAELAITEPVVAIITRTKNRPVLLKRAAESVANQTYPHYQWVIVNDGGDEEVVRQVIGNCAVDRRKIKLVSNSRSLGMEAASNRGIQASKSDYVLIHDDDDSLAPTYLEKSVSYLEARSGKKYGGVITQTTYVSEEIRGDDVIIHDRYPYNDWIRNVQIGEMMTNNIFAPISFLYRRSVYDAVGGYNEELPVLGDWFFNLEFLLQADIGVLLEPLAFYHHRDRGDSSRSGIYSNSVIGGQSKHEEYASIMRNMFFRKYADKHPGALGALMGYMISEIRHQSHQTRSVVDGNGMNASRPVTDTVCETADKAWLIASINWLLSNRPVMGVVPRGKRGLLSPDSDWETVKTAAKPLMEKIGIPPGFNEKAYLKKYPDVAVAVSQGAFSSGFAHYVFYGRNEGRDRPV